MICNSVSAFKHSGNPLHNHPAGSSHADPQLRQLGYEDNKSNTVKCCISSLPGELVNNQEWYKSFPQKQLVCYQDPKYYKKEENISTQWHHPPFWWLGDIDLPMSVANVNDYGFIGLSQIPRPTNLIKQLGIDKLGHYIPGEIQDINPCVSSPDERREGYVVKEIDVNTSELRKCKKTLNDLPPCPETTTQSKYNTECEKLFDKHCTLLCPMETLRQDPYTIYNGRKNSSEFQNSSKNEMRQPNNQERAEKSEADEENFNIALRKGEHKLAPHTASDKKVRILSCTHPEYAKELFNNKDDSHRKDNVNSFTHHKGDNVSKTFIPQCRNFNSPNAINETSKYYPCRQMDNCMNQENLKHFPTVSGKNVRNNDIVSECISSGKKCGKKSVHFDKNVMFKDTDVLHKSTLKNGRELVDQHVLLKDNYYVPCPYQQINMSSQNQNITGRQCRKNDDNNNDNDQHCNKHNPFCPIFNSECAEQVKYPFTEYSKRSLPCSCDNSTVVKALNKGQDGIVSKPFNTKENKAKHNTKHGEPDWKETQRKEELSRCGLPFKTSIIKEFYGK